MHRVLLEVANRVDGKTGNNLYRARRTKPGGQSSRLSRPSGRSTSAARSTPRITDLSRRFPNGIPGAAARSREVYRGYKYSRFALLIWAYCERASDRERARVRYRSPALKGNKTRAEVYLSTEWRCDVCVCVVYTE